MASGAGPGRLRPLPGAAPRGRVEPRQAEPSRAAPLLPSFLPALRPSVRPSAARDVIGRQPEHHAAAGGAAAAGGGRGEDQGERGARPGAGGADELLLLFLPPLSVSPALGASRGTGDEGRPRWGSVAFSTGRSCDK